MPQKHKRMLIESSHKLSQSREFHLKISDYQIDCVKQYKTPRCEFRYQLKMVVSRRHYS